MSTVRDLLFTGLLLMLIPSVQAAVGDVTVTIVDGSDSVISAGQKDVTSPFSDVRAKIVPDSGDPNYSDLVSVSTTYPGKTVEISLESSTDLTTWSDATAGTFSVIGGKKFFQVRTETVFNEFILVDASGSETIDDFLIGRYEVTKEEWDQTYDWAIANGYDFDNTGSGCDLNHPVHTITWNDVVKWCNARSEKEGLNPVYYTSATHSLANIYRSGNVSLISDYISGVNNGYRLPTSTEWEFAANGGAESNAFLYSGSDTPGDVAIYSVNSTTADCPQDAQNWGTFPVGTKDPNAIDTHDMSGNVFEFVEDLIFANRVIRGGSFKTSTSLEIIDFLLTYKSLQQASPEISSDDVGFRLAMNAPAPAQASESITIESQVLTSPGGKSWTGKGKKDMPSKR